MPKQAVTIKKPKKMKSLNSIKKQMFKTPVIKPKKIKAKKMT